MIEQSIFAGWRINLADLIVTGSIHVHICRKCGEEFQCDCHLQEGASIPEQCNWCRDESYRQQ